MKHLKLASLITVLILLFSVGVFAQQDENKDLNEGALEPGTAPEEEPAQEEQQNKSDCPIDKIFAKQSNPLPKVDKPLNRQITIKFKCGDPMDRYTKKKKRKKCKPKVIKGKLLAVFEEEVPGYTVDKITWIPMDTVVVVQGVQERNVPWKKVRKIWFDHSYEKQFVAKSKNPLDMISCVSDLEIGPNWRECQLQQRYKVKLKHDKREGYIDQKRKVLFLIKTKKGEVTVPVYIGKLRVDNSKAEGDCMEEDLAKLLINIYKNSVESIEIK